jgi:beta-N-acetylhexosaminidase
VRRRRSHRVRPYRAEDESAVLGLWARVLPQWPVGAGSFRARTVHTEQFVAVLGGTTVGYISVAREGTRAQLTSIFVDPEHHRAGIGSDLLSEARRALRARGAEALSAGSGVGAYFWPGAPAETSGGWGFFHAHGFERTGEVAADLLGDLTNFCAPTLAVARLGAGISLVLARENDAAEVIGLQERHFPYWAEFYEERMTRGSRVLVARAGKPILGACMVDVPDEHDFLWPEVVPGAVGAIGCVGVDPQYRGRGIGLAMVARACELLASGGAEVCYCGYTNLTDWYAQLGFRHWRGYIMASADLR